MIVENATGWEVEGFIDRLTKRDIANEERLVLEAISHLRAFSRDCEALRESNRELRAENDRLREHTARDQSLIADLLHERTQARVEIERLRAINVGER